MDQEFKLMVTAEHVPTKQFSATEMTEDCAHNSTMITGQPPLKLMVHHLAGTMTVANQICDVIYGVCRLCPKKWQDAELIGQLVSTQTLHGIAE